MSELASQSSYYLFLATKQPEGTLGGSKEITVSVRLLWGRMCRVRRRESTTGRSVRRPDRCSQCGTRWPRDRVTTVLRSICKHNHYHQINIYCFPTTIFAIPSIKLGYFSFPIYAQDDMSLIGSEKIICYKGVYFNPAKHGQFGHLLF